MAHSEASAVDLPMGPQAPSRTIRPTCTQPDDRPVFVADRPPAAGTETTTSAALGGLQGPLAIEVPATALTDSATDFWQRMLIAGTAMVLVGLVGRWWLMHTRSRASARVFAGWGRYPLETLSLAIEQTADSVLITDRNGVIEYVNPAFEQMTGFTRAEVIGATPRILRSGVQPPSYYDKLWSTIKAGQTFQTTLTNRRHDGELYEEDQTITPIRDMSGEISHFVSTGRDVTQRKRTQEALKRLNQQLEREAARVANILHDEAAQFLTAAHITLSTVAHDVGPRLRERLSEVRAHLNQVEERLREISHELHPRIVVDLGLVDAVKFLASSFSRRTGVNVSVAATVTHRHGTPTETILYRFVQEALNNVNRHARASSVTIEVIDDANCARCVVQDDGVGFDSTPFKAGTQDGFGLKLMQDRIEALGGTLSIKSVPGGGTELRASVPVEF